MGDERRKWEKKKCTDHVIEKGKTKLVSEFVSKYYSSKLVSIFTHQNFLVKMVRLLRVIF
jgi:ribosomal protein L10